ncbi:MAG: DUF2273 domain-containing protein [Fusobacterium sp.]|uniref:DUF2273 domain-containing protein n=1 Tax=Fusobacterium sp. TaxID=68766 RepID=UPI0026DD55D8|nr:DUF2273 domain-containing protein [Fusobacterium sp.]MDO4689679.1 DUF2273 domain-containing protein [Fusobacterium sp.]
MSDNILEVLLEKIINNWKKYLGCFLGFVAGTTIMKYGFLKALVIFALAFIGYKLGDISFSKKLKKTIISKLEED